MAVAILRNNNITNITVLNRQQGLITVHLVIFISQVVCKMLSSSIVVVFVSKTSTFLSSVDIKKGKMLNRDYTRSGLLAIFLLKGTGSNNLRP